jgi:lipopolysaccharide transport system ATP-binding protein
MTIAVSVENVSKSYRLGAIGGGTLASDLNRWWARLRGQPDPLLKIGDIDHGNRDTESIRALENVSFQVEAGQALGIIGRNGAGKSTLLKILSRVTAPTTGAIKARGRIASLLEVGTGFHPELTGRENIYLNGSILGMSHKEIEKKFDEIVSFSEVERFIDTPVKRYSSGMYVRLAFAVAAHLDPEIMVVDEVLAVGDAAFQRKCLGKMSENTGEGRTVLFVSHNMSAINRLCSRAILLEKGRLLTDGPASEVTARYLSGTVEESGERTWGMEGAPGNSQLKLLAVHLLDRNGVKKSVFDVSEEITVRIEYAVMEPRLSFRISLLVNTQGVIAFATIEPTEMEREKTGNYVSSVTIPAHLLSECEYTIGITAFSSAGAKQHFFQVKDAISLQIYDSMLVPSARGDYVQNYGGVVRPLLQWNVARNPL